MMGIDDQKFMCTSGLIQWLAAGVMQGQRLQAIYSTEFPNMATMDGLSRRLLVARSHAEADYLASAANHILRYREWGEQLGIRQGVDFSELDKFDARKIRDLRNMREHVIDYFLERGNSQNRWFVETPEYKADASSVVGTMIGGRLDYKAFTTACEIVLQEVLAVA
jgi:hypothetical protein